MKRKEKKRKSAGKKKLFSYDNAIKFIAIFAMMVIVRAALTSDKVLIETKINLEKEAIRILETITDENTPISVLNSNELVEEKIGYLDQMDYVQVKDLLGAESDFCIFFEDVTGDVVKINGVTSGIGSSKIHINGKPCE